MPSNYVINVISNADLMRYGNHGENMPDLHRFRVLCPAIARVPAQKCKKMSKDSRIGT